MLFPILKMLTIHSWPTLILGAALGLWPLSDSFVGLLEPTRLTVDNTISRQ